MIPWWWLALGPESALLLPPPAGTAAGFAIACIVYVCRSLWCASHGSGPPLLIVAPSQASALHAQWPEDLYWIYIYKLAPDATVL